MEAIRTRSLFDMRLQIVEIHHEGINLFSCRLEPPPPVFSQVFLACASPAYPVKGIKCGLVARIMHLKR